MVLETDRLTLREYVTEDFDALFEIVSDIETMQHYPAPFDEDKTRSWIQWNLDNYKKCGFGLWAVVLKETGEFIGDCGITIQDIDGEMLPEIGYHIHKKYWRKGFAKEAARAVRDVYGTILIRDLVEKYRIRNTSEFASISEFMMDNIGNLLSPNNICKTLNNDQREITRKTVSKYIGYLENAFLFYEAKRYDLKGKKYLENNSKFYLCDPAFRYAVNGTRNMDFGRVYENIVYLELRRRGYEVYVGKLYKKEVDFVAKKRDTLIYIQVSDNISDETTFEREDCWTRDF